MAILILCNAYTVMWFTQVVVDVERCFNPNAQHFNMFTPRADIIPLSSMEASSCPKAFHLHTLLSTACNFTKTNAFIYRPYRQRPNMPISKRNSRYPYPPRRDRNIQPDAETLSVTGDLALALDVRRILSTRLCIDRRADGRVQWDTIPKPRLTWYASILHCVSRYNRLPVSPVLCWWPKRLLISAEIIVSAALFCILARTVTGKLGVFSTVEPCLWFSNLISSFQPLACSPLPPRSQTSIGWRASKVRDQWLHNQEKSVVRRNACRMITGIVVGVSSQGSVVEEIAT